MKRGFEMKIFIRIISIIVNMLLIFLSSLIFPMLSAIFIVFLILSQIYFNKMTEKINLIWTTLIINIPLIIAICFCCYNNVQANIKLKNEWNAIKEDYRIINDFVIDYYNGYYEERTSDNDTIILDFGNNYTYLTDYFNDHIEMVQLDENETNSLKRINEYYTGKKAQTFIRADKEYIEYTNDSGYFRIIYSKNGKRPKIEGIKTWNLGENWYMLMSNSR